MGKQHVDCWKQLMRPPIRFITSMRHPLKRSISHFYFDNELRRELNYTEWYRLHGDSPHEGWGAETDRVWTNNHMAQYTGLSTPPLTAKLWQRFSFVFLTERMGFCMLNFLRSLIKGPNSMLPAHVQLVMDTLPKRARVNKNLDVRRKNITQQFETIWTTKGQVPQSLFQINKVWKLFKER